MFWPGETVVTLAARTKASLPEYMVPVLSRLRTAAEVTKSERPGLGRSAPATKLRNSTLVLSSSSMVIGETLDPKLAPISLPAAFRMWPFGETKTAACESDTAPAAAKPTPPPLPMKSTASDPLEEAPTVKTAGAMTVELTLTTVVVVAGKVTVENSVVS